MRRPRGPGGRFLTADEVAEMDRAKDAGGSGDFEDKENPSTAPAKLSGGSKRKSETQGGTPSKKTKTAPASESRTSAEDEDEDDEEGDDEG